MSLEYYIIGVLLGIIFIQCLFCNSSGTPPKVSFEWNDYFINGSLYIGSRHIHHWLIFSCLYLFLLIPLYLLFPKSSIILISSGFSIVMIIHGLLYDDWSVF